MNIRRRWTNFYSSFLGRQQIDGSKLFDENFIHIMLSHSRSTSPSQVLIAYHPYSVMTEAVRE